MAFGKPAHPARVFEYGCLPPLEGEAAAVDAMHGRLTLWNCLVELEHNHQAQVDAALHDAGYDPEDRRPLAEAPQGRKAGFRAAALKPVLATLEQDRVSLAKQAARESGLLWCNHEDVIMNYQIARKRPGDLRFHAWRLSDGKVSVRFQTGLAVEDAFGTDTMLQLQPVPPEAWTAPRYGYRRRLQRSIVRIRVASTEQHKPIWLVLPIVLHRPLPEGQSIRNAAVIRERVGRSYRWKLVVTVRLADTAPPLCRGEGVLALDVGWRRRPDGLRVAMWQDDAGRWGEVLLPESWLRERQQVNNLRSLRDQHFNAVKAALGAWLAAAPGVPAWLAEQTAHLALWRSPERLVQVVQDWDAQRFPGDDAGFTLAYEWYKRERHLYDYEANLRDQLDASRREHYRIFAAMVARTYREVRIEDFDLRGMAAVKPRQSQNGANEPTPAGADLPLAARNYRTWAAISVLRQALRNACTRESVLITEVSAAYTTQTCQHCGTVQQFDAAREVEHTCIVCERTWDQDQNAAANLLR